MGSFRWYILFTFLWGFYPLTDVFSQPSTVEVYDYSYVTRGGKTIQESTTIYVTDQSHEIYNGYNWERGRYYVIAIISRKGKFLLQTFSDKGKRRNGNFDEYSLIGNSYFVKKILISESVVHIIFYKFTAKSTITLSKHSIL